MRRLPRILLAVLVVALAGSSTAAALAAAPTRDVQKIDFSFTVDGVCAFPLVEHVQGTVIDTTFVDRQGQIARELVVEPNLRVSLSANGKTLTTVSPSVGHGTENPDGSFTLAITGLSFHITIPQQGTVAISAGRTVVILTDNDAQIIFQHGTFSSTTQSFEEQLCGALS